MVFDIVSIGDGEMLANAFQGVAMIFGSGSLGNIIKSGFMLGTLIICIRYLTNLEFPLHHVLVGVTVYSIMFVPTGTVTIEDVYNGEVRVVDNVPLGVAAPMSIISSMGVNMTRLFESAFSTPDEAGLLYAGYLDSLNTLIKLRNIGIGTVGSDGGWNGDLSKTITGYIEQCVMFDLELSDSYHEVTREGLQKSPDLWEAMKTTFINLDIITYLPSQPEGRQETCYNAYINITNYITGNNFIDKLDNEVSSLLGIMDAGERADQKIDDAAAALSLAGFDSQTFMRNALLASYLKDGPTAFIMRTGQEQLNLQWASEQSMFNTIERPLMAFVEMFTVAISPIVAFLTTLGPIGMVMIVRYIQLILWIALWGPLMAVCNLYITVVTTRALRVIALNSDNNGSGLQAMINHDQLYQTLETWLSAGGMLASSVPALSLMIVYGGSVAATNLAGRMTSAASSSVNPGRLMAEPASIAPTMSMGGMSEYSQNAGAKKAGKADMDWSNATGMQSALQSKAASSVSANSSFGQTISNIKQDTQRSGAMQSNVNAQMSGFTSANTSGSNWSSGTTRTSGDGYSLTNAEAEVVQAGAAVNAPTPAITAGLEAKAGTSATRAKEISDIINKTRSDMVSGGHQNTSTSGSSNTSSNQTFSGKEEMSSQAKQFTDQAQRALEAQEEFSKVASLTDSAMKQTNRSGSQLAHDLVKAGAGGEIAGALRVLDQKLGTAGYNQSSADAQHEINTTSAQELGAGSPERAALHGMLMLRSADPVAAQEIINKYLSPTDKGSGVDIKPDEYQGQHKSPDDIVSQDQADGFKAFAHDREVSMGTVPAYQEPGGFTASDVDEGGEYGRGDSPGDIVSQGTPEGFRSKAHENEIDSDTGGGEGGGGRGSAAKPSEPQMPLNPGHKPAVDHAGGSTKPSAPHTSGNPAHGTKSPADHTPPKTQAASGGKHTSNGYSFNDAGSRKQKQDTQQVHSPKVSWANDPKESNGKTSVGSSHGVGVGTANVKGGVDDPNKIRGQIMNSKLLRDHPVEGGRLFENAASNQIDATADVAKHLLESGPVQQSKAAAQEMLENIGWIEKEKSDNELPHIKDDNDLPPNPKD